MFLSKTLRFGSNSPLAKENLYLHKINLLWADGALCLYIWLLKTGAWRKKRKGGFKRGWRDEGSHAGCCTPGGKSRSALLGDQC